MTKKINDLSIWLNMTSYKPDKLQYIKIIYITMQLEKINSMYKLVAGKKGAK